MKCAGTRATSSFSEGESDELAVYTHHHDHDHDVDGNVIHKHEDSKGEGVQMSDLLLHALLAGFWCVALVAGPPGLLCGLASHGLFRRYPLTLSPVGSSPGPAA